MNQTNPSPSTNITPLPSSYFILHPLSFTLLLWAFFQRDLYTALSYRSAFVLNLVGIFFRAFTFFFIAQFVNPAGHASLAVYGGDYFAFTLIGLAFNLYVSVGLNAFADGLRQAQMSGTLEAMMMTPTPVPLLIVGSAVWNYSFTTGRVLLYLLIGWALGVDFSQANWLAATAGLLLSIVAFASIGIISASVIMVIKRGEPVTALLENLSGLVGGVYYPVELLPVWLSPLAYFLPITYALRLMRLALLTGAGWAELRPDFIALALFSLVLFPLSLVCFRWAVDQARQEGSLAHF